MSNKNLLIIGAGQYGAVVYEIAEAMGRFEKIDFLDDNAEQADDGLMCDGKVIGKISELEKFAGEYGFGIAAVEDADQRYLYISRLEQSGYQIPVLVHPRAFVGKYARVGKGSVIEAMAAVQSGAELGIGVQVSVGVIINHSVYVGDYCNLGAGSIVAEKSLVRRGTNLESGKVFSGIDDLTVGGMETTNQRLGALDLNPDWIQEHKAKYGTEPNLFDGC